MSQKKRDIIILIRAYNDLDIQLSLIDKLAQDGRFNLRVIGYPCDGDIGMPNAHEAISYFTDQYDITIETVLDKTPATLFLRVLHRIERRLAAIKRKKLARLKSFKFVLSVFHVAVLKIMRRNLNAALPWLDRVCQDWNPAAIIMDEACVQKGRSYMIDKILPEKIEQGTKLYAIQTGQMVYADAAPNKAAGITTQTEKVRRDTRSCVHRFMIPSALDAKAVKNNFPKEAPEIHGNLRMDPTWLKKLHQDILVPPYEAKENYAVRLPKGGPRVVFMLSKLGYGIELEEIRKTISAVCNIEGIACAIKPHTRGMKFDFMSEKEINGATIVPDMPSAALIEWADIILFTGSGIAFHALVLGKRAGFLKHCQYLETIFDSGEVCDLFQSCTETVSFLKDWQEKGETPVSNDIAMKRKDWQEKHLYAGIKNGATAQHYCDLILSDLIFE